MQAAALRFGVLLDDLLRARPFELRSHPGDKLARRKGLHQIVVGALAEPFRGGVFAGPGREQDDRQVRVAGSSRSARTSPNPSSFGIITSLRIRSGGGSARRKRRLAVGDGLHLPPFAEDTRAY